MILIPSGKAVIGSSLEERRNICKRWHVHPTWLEPEGPKQEIAVKAFLIDRFPVTNEQFVRFCEETAHPWIWLDGVRRELEKTARHPVALVNIDDARAYARWERKRLPTAGEWEYAARGPEGWHYPWGNSWNPARCNNNSRETAGGLGPTPVDAYPEGCSPFGVMDMTGNLCEWTDSPYPASKGGNSRIVKGGFWKQAAEYRFRPAAVIMSQLGGNQQNYIGFRCAADAPEDV